MRPGLQRALRGAGTIFRREPWWAEFWSAATSLAWACLSVFGAMSLSEWPSMQVLTDIADDHTWHLIAGGLGASQLLFLVLDHRWLRWAMAVCMCWFWGVLTVGVWMALPWAPGAAVYAGWCGINVFSILRLLRHHG